MKFLIGLCIVQAVLVGFFGYRVLVVDARTNEIAAMVAMNKTARGLPASARYTNGRPIATGPSAEEIRRIIREEIAALEGGAQASPNKPAKNGSDDVTVAAKSSAYSEADARRRRASVQQDLDYYIGRGKIEGSEMAALQQEIMRLPPDQRSEMLSKLMRAMSSGDLEGHL